MRQIKYYSFTMAYWIAERNPLFNLLACGQGCTLGCKLAFTMAEILISLTIIGIIAAITLPSLQANINEKTWATQRKALYNRMSQAISLMDSLNGYGVVMGENGVDTVQTAQKATQTFITDGLSKVLKINNICDKDHLDKCGFPEKITKMGFNSKLDTPKTIKELNNKFDTPYSVINTNSAAFETANGESILTFYNPNCAYNNSLYSNTTYIIFQPTMCVNFIYDLNGKKGPNKVGKDIGFMTVFFPTDSEIAAPYPMKTIHARKSSNQKYFTIGYGNLNCRNNFGNDTKMASIEELESIFVNNILGYYSNTSKPFFLEVAAYASSTLTDDNRIQIFSATDGLLSTSSLPPYDFTENNGATRRIFCVKK